MLSTHPRLVILLPFDAPDSTQSGAACPFGQPTLIVDCRTHCWPGVLLHPTRRSLFLRTPATMSMLASCFGFGSRARKSALPFRHDPPPADLGVVGGAAGGLPLPAPPPLGPGNGVGGGGDGGGGGGDRGSNSPYVFAMPPPTGDKPDGSPTTPPATARSRYPDAPEGVGRGGGGERLPLSPSEGTFFASAGVGGGGSRARWLAGAPSAGGEAGGGSAVFSDFGGGLGGGSVVSETRKRDNLRIPRSLRRGGNNPRPAPFPPAPTFLNLSDGTPMSEAALAALAPSPPSASVSSTAAEAAADASAFMKVQRWVREASQCKTLVVIAPTEPITNREDYPGEDVPPPDAEEHRAAGPRR